MNSIPQGILREIFTFLQPEDLGRISRVCKFWKLLSEEGLLWKKYCDSDTQIFLGRDPDVNWKQEFIRSENSDILNIKDRKGKGWHLPTSPPFDFVLKIALAGASGVGKSSLVEHFQGKPWTEHSRQSSRNVYANVPMVEEKITFNLQIWDHGGRSRIYVKPWYFKFAVLLLYDVTRRETFEALDSIYEEIKKYTAYEGSSPDYKIVVCANKSDLRNEEKVQYLNRDFKREEFVPDMEGLKWAQKHNCKFMSISTKQNLNLSETLRIVIGNVNAWRKVKGATEVKEQKHILN